MSKTAKHWVETFNLQKHPEGGWYKEIYRATEKIDADGLPPRFGGSRDISTAIYFLLESGEISAFHRIKSDELWHFYEGTGSLGIHIIYPNGKYELKKLGRNLENQEAFMQVVPAGAWFASETISENSYALVGCTVAIRL